MKKRLQVVKSWLIAQLLLEAGEKQIAASVNQDPSAYLFELSPQGVKRFKEMVAGNFPIAHFQRPLEGGDNFEDLILEVTILEDEILLGLTGVYAWGPHKGKRVELPFIKKGESWSRTLYWLQHPWSRGEPWVCDKDRNPLPVLTPRPIGGLDAIPFEGLLYVSEDKVFVTRTFRD